MSYVLKALENTICYSKKANASKKFYFDYVDYPFLLR